jgi:hypothetical protein
MDPKSCTSFGTTFNARSPDAGGHPALDPWMVLWPALPHIEPPSNQASSSSGQHCDAANCTNEPQWITRCTGSDV